MISLTKLYAYVGGNPISRKDPSGEIFPIVLNTAQLLYNLSIVQELLTRIVIDPNIPPDQRKPRDPMIIDYLIDKVNKIKDNFKITEMPTSIRPHCQ